MRSINLFWNLADSPVGRTMKISSLGPWVQGSPVEPAGSEQEKLVSKENQGARPINKSGSTEIQDDGQQQLAQGFVRFIDFVSRLRKEKTNNKKKQPRDGRKQAVGRYLKVVKFEELQDQLGYLLNKKS